MGKLKEFSLSGYVGAQMSKPPAGQERTIEVITGEILEAKRVGGEAILTIGKGLIEAKGLLSHGEWLPWLNEKVDFSERTATRFMRLAREWTNQTALSDLGATKALALLALPESERDAFMSEEHLVDGVEKAVIDMSARELEKAIRDREEALADKTTAEEARAKLEQDMSKMNEMLEAAWQARDRALQEAKHSQEALQASEQEVSHLSQELDELKARPVEVAVEVDQEAVARARAEGEAAKAAELAELQKKLDKAKAEAGKLSAARDEAEEKRKAAEASMSAIQAKLDAALRTEKSSVVSSDADLAQFKLLFEQAQTIVDQMRGLLVKVRGREDDGAAEKLARALTALSDKMREAVA